MSELDILRNLAKVVESYLAGSSDRAYLEHVLAEVHRVQDLERQPPHQYRSIYEGVDLVAAPPENALTVRLGEALLSSGIVSFGGAGDQDDRAAVEAALRQVAPSDALRRSALARARRARRPATLTVSEWERTLELFQHRCALCDAPWTVVDFAHPVTLGGGATAGNCYPSCARCTIAKGQRALGDIGTKRSNAVNWQLTHNVLSDPIPG